MFRSFVGFGFVDSGLIGDSSVPRGRALDVESTAEVCCGCGDVASGRVCVSSFDGGGGSVGVPSDAESSDRMSVGDGVGVGVSIGVDFTGNVVVGCTAKDGKGMTLSTGFLRLKSG